MKNALSSVLFQVTLSLQFQIFLLELQIIQLRLRKNSLNRLKMFKYLSEASKVQKLYKEHRPFFGRCSL